MDVGVDHCRELHRVILAGQLQKYDCCHTAIHPSARVDSMSTVRTQTLRPRYYIDDLFHSVSAEPESTVLYEEPGRDRDPPEYESESEYNPFRLDIFLVGNMFLSEFLHVG